MVTLTKNAIEEKFHCFDSKGLFPADQDKNFLLLEQISKELIGWNCWRWAKKIGPFNLNKNNASWKIRFRKNPLKTLPLFLIWQMMPTQLLFKLAVLTQKRPQNNEKA